MQSGFRDNKRDILVAYVLRPDKWSMNTFILI